MLPSRSSLVSPGSGVNQSQTGHAMIHRAITSTQAVISNLITKEQLKEMKAVSQLVSAGIDTFENALSLVGAPERKALIQAHKSEINRLADEGTLDQLIFFIHAYKEKQDLSDILPPVEDVLDLSHTEIFLALVFEQSKRSPRAEHINAIVKKAIEQSSIPDILSSARGLQGREFEKFFAFEMVRGILNDRALSEDGIEGDRYENLTIERDSIDLYRMFKRVHGEPSLSLDEISEVDRFHDSASQEALYEQRMDEAEYLSIDDPLIMTLSEIQDYDPDLFVDLVSHIKLVRKRQPKESLEKQSKKKVNLVSYPPRLSLASYREFRELVVGNIHSTPSKIKASYKKDVNGAKPDATIPLLSFEGETRWRMDEEDDKGEEEEYYLNNFGDDVDDVENF